MTKQEFKQAFPDIRDKILNGCYAIHLALPDNMTYSEFVTHVNSDKRIREEYRKLLVALQDRILLEMHSIASGPMAGKEIVSRVNAYKIILERLDKSLEANEDTTVTVEVTYGNKTPEKD